MIRIATASFLSNTITKEGCCFHTTPSGSFSPHCLVFELSLPFMQDGVITFPTPKRGSFTVERGRLTTESFMTHGTFHMPQNPSFICICQEVKSHLLILLSIAS